jgi:hypothetical protein
MSSKSDETRRNCGHAAKSYTELLQRVARIQLIGRGPATTAQFVRQILDFPIFTVFTTRTQRQGPDTGYIRDRRQLSIPLVSQDVAGAIVGNFTLTIFFVIATQSSQPHRNLR